MGYTLYYVFGCIINKILIKALHTHLKTSVIQYVHLWITAFVPGLNLLGVYWLCKASLLWQQFKCRRSLSHQYWEGHHPRKLCNCQVHNILTQNRPLLLSRKFLVSLPKGVVQLPMYWMSHSNTSGPLTPIHSWLAHLLWRRSGTTLEPMHVRVCTGLVRNKRDV